LTVWCGYGKWNGGVVCVSSCGVGIEGECQAALSMLQGVCQLRLTGSHLCAEAGVVIYVGGFGEKLAWCGGKESFGIIVVGISSFSNEQNPSRICCLKGFHSNE